MFHYPKSVPGSDEWIEFGSYRIAQLNTQVPIRKGAKKHGDSADQSTGMNTANLKLPPGDRTNTSESADTGMLGLLAQMASLRDSAQTPAAGETRNETKNDQTTPGEPSPRGPQTAAGTGDQKNPVQKMNQQAHLLNATGSTNWTPATIACRSPPDPLALTTGLPPSAAGVIPRIENLGQPMIHPGLAATLPNPTAAALGLHQAYDIMAKQAGFASVVEMNAWQQTMATFGAGAIPTAAALPGMANPFGVALGAPPPPTANGVLDFLHQNEQLRGAGGKMWPGNPPNPLGNKK